MLEQRVSDTIARYGMMEGARSVLAAVSGGADSTALLLLLAAWCAPREIALGAVHLNHGLRGEESDRDERFVRGLCAEMHIPLFCERADIAALAGKRRCSVELAARDARYELFERTAERGGYDCIATAHTADDNAETVLHHLIRGSGLAGLCGIPPVRGRIVRPLIEVMRGEIEQYLAARGQTFVVDSTNASPDYTRNRIRADILPLLKKENPALCAALGRMGERLRRDEEALSGMAERALGRADSEDGLSLPVLREYPPAVQVRALAQAAERAGCGNLAACHREALLRLVSDGSSCARQQLPGGVFAAKRYDRLFFEREQHGAFEPRLLHPGENALPSGGILLAEWLDAPPERENLNKIDTTAILDCDKIIGNLVLRGRLPGDRMAPLGGAGSKSLKKLYIDRKIPQPQRGLIPVLADDLGPCWCAALGADRRAAADSGSGRCLVLTVKGKEL